MIIRTEDDKVNLLTEKYTANNKQTILVIANINVGPNVYSFNICSIPESKFIDIKNMIIDNEKRDINIDKNTNITKGAEYTYIFSKLVCANYIKDNCTCNCYEIKNDEMLKLFYLINGVE